MDLSKYKEEIIDMYLNNFGINFIVEILSNRLNIKSLYFKQKIYTYTYDVLIEEGIYNLGGLY